MRTVEDLRGVHSGRTVFIMGSGPSLPEDLGKFEDCISIALNHTRLLFKPTYWLFGDGKFSRWHANKVASKVKPDIGSLICNMGHVGWIHKKFDSSWDFSVYVFKNRLDKRDHIGHWLDWNEDGLLPGRWTIVTTALSLSVLLGATNVVLLGIDMSIPEKKVYSEQLSGVDPPKKQWIYVGQWKKWLAYGFKRGMWPVKVMTTSPYLIEACPGLPIRRVTLNEAIKRIL